MTGAPKLLCNVQNLIIIIVIADIALSIIDSPYSTRVMGVHERQRNFISTTENGNQLGS